MEVALTYILGLHTRNWSCALSKVNDRSMSDVSAVCLFLPCWVCCVGLLGDHNQAVSNNIQPRTMQLAGALKKRQCLQDSEGLVWSNG